MTKTITLDTPNAERLFDSVQFHRAEVSFDGGRTFRPAVEAYFSHVHGFLPKDVEHNWSVNFEGVLAYEKVNKQTEVVTSYNGHFSTFRKNAHRRLGTVDANTAFEQFPALRRHLVALVNGVAAQADPQKVEHNYEPVAVLRKAVLAAANEGLLSAREERVALDAIDKISYDDPWDE